MFYRNFGELYFKIDKLRGWSGQHQQTLAGFEKIQTVGKGNLLKIASIPALYWTNKNLNLRGEILYFSNQGLRHYHTQVDSFFQFAVL